MESLQPKFPANSLLLNEISEFWAEFDDVAIEFKKFRAPFPVLGIWLVRFSATCETRFCLGLMPPLRPRGALSPQTT